MHRIRRAPSARIRPARHRPDRGAVAHGAAHGDREQFRLQHARRGARRAQHDVAGAGARRSRRRGRAHGLRAVAAAQSAGCLEGGRPAACLERRRRRGDRGGVRRKRAHRPQRGDRSAAEGAAAERRRTRSRHRAAGARGDPRLARRRRAAPAERRGGRGLPRGRIEAGPDQCAVRKRGRAAAGTRRHRAADGEAGRQRSPSIRGSAASTRRPPPATCCWRSPAPRPSWSTHSSPPAPKRSRTGCRFPRSRPAQGFAAGATAGMADQCRGRGCPMV